MTKPYLVCIDSDGCVFDTMETKHKECFCPSYIKYFNLQAVSKYARQAWDFANLYSATRGINRFLALRRALDLLEGRKEVAERGFVVPSLPEFREYLDLGGKLNNAGLEAYLAEHPEKEEIKTVLAWSYDVNRRIGEEVYGVPPFPFVKECLKELSPSADIVIVSATPEEALIREWKEHGLYDFLLAVKGQESGTKKEVIASLKGNYEEGKVLMLGDAPGDRDAAWTNGVFFYPICPDEEPKSWEQFQSVIPAFLEGRYGEMEKTFVSYFETLLPQEPSWN